MSGPDLVVLSLEAWDGVWRRNQYLIDGLLRQQPGLQVLFVEPPSDVVHDALHGRRPRVGAGARTVDGYDGRLTLLQPTKWLPRVVGPAADALLRRTLRRSVERIGGGRPVLWVNDPDWAGLVLETGWPSLYDMTDDWLAADRSERAHDRLVVNEDILLDRCAAVVVCSTGLESSRGRRRPDLVLIPNGVDVARYREPATRPDDLPSGPVALYAGTLHEDRLDTDLVVRTGSALEAIGGHLVLVGPDALSSAHSATLRSAPGVDVLGARDFATIPAYLQHADALVVPHLVTGFTESLDPIKRYEYLAVGRPIVATPVAGFRELDREPGVVVASGDAFAAAVLEVLRAPAPARPTASVPDWADRVRAMSDVIESIRRS